MGVHFGSAAFGSAAFGSAASGGAAWERARWAGTTAESSPWVSAAWTAGITITVIFIAVVAIGFWLIARRKARGARLDTIGSLHQRANILLVRVDDAIKNAEDELGYAVAQFGDTRATQFEKVLIEAKAKLTEAFGLQQTLDDVTPDSQTQRRDRTARIIHLCETTQASLAQHEREFAELRQREHDAPADLAGVQEHLDRLVATLAEATKTLAALSTRYAPAAIASVADNIDRAKDEVKQARDAVTLAEERIAAGSATPSATPSAAPSANSSRPMRDPVRTPDPPGTATDAIRSALEHAHRAGQLVTAIGTLQSELGKASDAVNELQRATRQNLSEARALRDAPPDADSSSAIAAAIQTVEAALAAKEPLGDPLASLEILRAANAELDTSMASARNQQRRLEGARTALVGALVGARSQLAATRDYITTRRDGVGAEARTRLAESERLLAVAENETDPVAALDSARSSATYSRDADAIARYDLMSRS